MGRTNNFPSFTTATLRYTYSTTTGVHPSFITNTRREDAYHPHISFNADMKHYASLNTAFQRGNNEETLRDAEMNLTEQQKAQIDQCAKDLGEQFAMEGDP